MATEQKQAQFEIKNYKSAGYGTDGDMFSASLYMDGKRVARVHNGGHGGPDHFDWLDKKAADAFDAHVKSLPPEDCDFGTKKMTLSVSDEMFVGTLITAFLRKKESTRLTKKATVFRIEGDDNDSYRSIKSGKTREVVDAFIAKTFPDKKVIEINYRRDL